MVRTAAKVSTHRLEESVPSGVCNRRFISSLFGGWRRHQELREQDFDDRDILNIIYAICLYNFNDRMAEATGTTAMIFSLPDNAQMETVYPVGVTLGAIP